MDEAEKKQEIARLGNEIQVVNGRIVDLKREIAQCGFLQKGKKRKLEQSMSSEKELLDSLVAKYREALADAK